MLLGGCKRKPADGVADGGLALLDPDGGGEIVSIAVPDAGAGATAAAPILHAVALITPVMNIPEWAPHDPSTASEERKGAMRLGYLRKGDTVAVESQLVKKSNCPEGWYELLPPPGSPPGTRGGFVCGKDATLDPDEKELASAPHPPNMAGPLPYDYGLNLVDGAPLYRRPPLRRERKQYERGLEVGRAYRKKDGDDSAPAPAAAGPSKDGDPAWYLAHKDRSQISMDDLKGETSLIVQRMVKGFYLGLDKEVHAFAGTFWRTTRGMFVPKEHVLVHDPKVEFEGVWLNAPGETRHLPLGWITNPHQWKYTLEDDAKMHRHEHVDRFTIVQLTGKKVVIENRKYWETEEGWWMRDMDGTVANPRPSAQEPRPWREVDRREPRVAEPRRVRRRQARVRHDRASSRPAGTTTTPSRTTTLAPASSAFARSTSPRPWTTTPRPTGLTRSRTFRGSCTSTGARPFTARSGTRASATSAATAA